MKILINLSTLLFSICVFSQITIDMKKINGTYQIPCKVNGIPMNFIFDTGASDVSISITEAKFLIKQGLLTEKDFIGKVNYQVANGDIVEGTQVNLKTINVGGVILKNIRASILQQQNSPLLLGQSAISQLGTYTINENKLIFGQSIATGKISNLEEKYGYETLKFDTNLKEFHKLRKLGSNNINTIYELEPLDTKIKSLYYVDFQKILVGFNNINDKLESIILMKRYQSTATKLPEDVQNYALDEFQNLIFNFSETLGKPKNYKDLEKDPLNYLWESKSLILQIKFQTGKYELDKNNNLKANYSNTVLFKKKKQTTKF